MSSAPGDHVDFFISYNHADEPWATWIAWQLEQTGFKVTIQAWDFRPGNNFVHEMQQAAATADRTVLALTENYLRSNFTQPEWYTAFAKDPKGVAARVVPVRVEPCNPEGLLGPIIYIDLVGKDMKDAAAALLTGISPGRAKPASPPAFPGSSSAGAAPPPAASPAPADAAPDWRGLGAPAPLRWRDDLEASPWASRRSGPAVLELHLVPSLDTARLEVRRLSRLANELADLGRGSGLFTVVQQLNVQATSELALAETVVERDIVDTGLVVTRDGQRGAWVTLPTDGLGSVFDPAEVQPRIEALLRALLGMDVPEAERYAVAAGLAHTMMLTVGSSDIVGRRSSASMRMNDQDIRVAPDEDISVVALRSSTAAVAEEIVARLSARLR
jgi:hypothetical protein